MNIRLKVKQTFNAKMVASRRRVRFDAGELLMLVDGPELPLESRFMRINGLRPSRGVECHYTLESAELRDKTDVLAQ